MGYEKECLEARINMLCGKVAQIYVGATNSAFKIRLKSANVSVFLVA